MKIREGEWGRKRDEDKGRRVGVLAGVPRAGLQYYCRTGWRAGRYAFVGRIWPAGRRLPAAEIRDQEWGRKGETGVGDKSPEKTQTWK